MLSQRALRAKALIASFTAFSLLAQGLPHVAHAAGLPSIPNPSLETASALDPTTPDQWHKGGWGTNQASFQYPVAGFDGASAAKITLTQYTDGDAKWYFDDVSVAPGDQYTFTDNYQSDVTTNVTVQYRMADGSLSYAWLASPAASPTTWAQARAVFTIPANVVSLTIFHAISAVGSLTVDNYAMVKTTAPPPPPPPPPPPTTGNLVPNASLASLDPTNPSLPAYWHQGGWGTNQATFSYPVTGESGNTAASITLSNYSSGDAKWYFDDVPVAAGDVYTYTDHYQSTAPTFLTAQFHLSNGTYIYADVGTPAASPGAWGTAQATITIPANATGLTVFHLINQAGTLTVDNFSLIKTTTPPPPPPPPPPTADNLIPNSALTVASPTDATLPANWHHGGWGSNNPTFQYPIAGANGGTGIGIAMSGYANGDAKWYFDPVAVAAGDNYTYTDQYQSNVPTVITAQFTMSNGTFTYQDLAFPSTASSWTTITTNFGIPTGATAVTIFHLINTNGTLAVSSPGLKKIPPVTLSQAMITFSLDDGFDTVYTAGRPIFDAAGIKPTLYITTGFLNTDGYLSTAQMLEMNRTGYEIGAHTRTHAHLPTLTQQQMTDEILGSKQDLLSMGATPVDTFAYPFGEYNNQVVQTVKDAGFIGARSVDTGYNDKSANRYLLIDQHVENTVTPAQVQTWIDQAIAQKKWLILEMHDQNANGDQWSNSPATLQAIVNYVKQTGIKTVTMEQGLNILNQP